MANELEINGPKQRKPRTTSVIDVANSAFKRAVKAKAAFDKRRGKLTDRLAAIDQKAGEIEQNLAVAKAEYLRLTGIA